MPTYRRPNLGQETAEPDVPVYEVEVIERAPGKWALRQTVNGTAQSTAAWLRALADQIDPPKPVIRGGATCGDEDPIQA